MKMAVAAALLSICFPVIAQEMRLFEAFPSVQHLDRSWDLFIEIEHKSEGDVYKSSSCVGTDEYRSTFPKSERAGSYWDYVDSRQTSRKVVEHALGKIGDLERVEIVIFLEEPIDYVKSLGFKQKYSELFCPFLIVAEWEHQLVYSKSYIDGVLQSNRVVTRMIDNIAGQLPTVHEFSFRFEEDAPVYIK